MSESIDTEAIRARAEAATPGPWEIFRYRHGGGRIHLSGDDGRTRTLIADLDGATESVATVYNEGDREFLFHAREDVPALLDEIDSLRAENERLRRERDLHRDHAARLTHIMDVDAGQIGAVAARADAAEAKLAAVSNDLREMGLRRDSCAAAQLAAEAKLAAVRETLTDLAEHGLRADLTPTVMFGDESHVYRQLTDYLRRLDSGLRQRARAGLNAEVVTDA